MTQPAKVQEPSMEEILASIRRIIADDEAKPQEAKLQEPKLSETKPSEAKPAAAEKSASPAAAAKPEKSDAAPPARAPVMKDIPPSAIPAARAAAAKVAPPPVAPAPAAPNSQNDIDAMLAGLDETTSESEVRPPLPDGEVFELTDEMAVPDMPPPQQEPRSAFHRIEPDDDLEFTENAAAKAMHRQPEPPPFFESAPAQPPPQILSRSTVSAVESAFNSLANTVLSNNARTLEDLVKEMLRPMLKSWLDDNLPGLVERIVKAEIERVSRGR
jgi:cell pole-organizing protein PopZ